MNGQELKWNHTDNGPKRDNGGWISAAAATAGKQLSNNSVYIKNTIFSESGSIFGAYANSASSSYDAPFSQSTITGNTVILDNVTMKPNTSYEPGWGLLLREHIFSPTPFLMIQQNLNPLTCQITLFTSKKVTWLLTV